jgi:hypothetical protein
MRAEYELASGSAFHRLFDLPAVIEDAWSESSDPQELSAYHPYEFIDIVVQSATIEVSSEYLSRLDPSCQISCTVHTARAPRCNLRRSAITDISKQAAHCDQRNREAGAHAITEGLPHAEVVAESVRKADREAHFQTILAQEPEEDVSNPKKRKVV